MKNTNKVLELVIITAIVLSTVLLFSSCDDISDNDGDGTTFTSMDAFNKWLEKQKDNTPDNPYRVKLNIKDLGYHELRKQGNGNKYVYIDLSDSTITSIGEQAFLLCGTLVGITIGDSVTSIGKEAFSYSGLASVIIGNNVTNIGTTSIGEKAFHFCGNLSSLTIGSGVKSIGKEAFSVCPKLTSVTIPNSVTGIGNNAFVATSLTSVTIQGNITANNFFGFDGDLKTKYLAGGPGTYTRPNGQSTTWTKK